MMQLNHLRYVNSNASDQPPTKFTPLMTFSPKYRQQIQSRQSQPQSLPQYNRNIPIRENANVSAVSASEIVSDKPKRMKWGEPTWFLLHTLAEKIKEEAFPHIRSGFFSMIVSLCANLPCPDCANHATRYMQSVNFNSIQTKKDLKELFFRFHNTVNQKKGFQQFPYNQLDAKYSAAVTINIVRNFLKHYQQKNFSVRMIANDFHRSRAVALITDWLNQNIQYFNV